MGHDLAQGQSAKRESGLFEDINGPRQLQDQQHDEHQTDDFQNTPGRQRIQVALQLRQFPLIERSDPQLGLERIDTHIDHSLLHIGAGQPRLSLGNALFMSLQRHGIAGTNHSRSRTGDESRPDQDGGLKQLLWAFCTW